MSVHYFVEEKGVLELKRLSDGEMLPLYRERTKAAKLMCEDPGGILAQEILRINKIMTNTIKDKNRS